MQLAHSSAHARPFTLLAVGAAILVATIIGTDLTFLAKLRESSLQTAETDLGRFSLMLAEQTDRSFKALDLVLSSVSDYIGRKGVTDVDAYRRLKSDYDTHLFLKEKITGLPQVDAVTMIDAEGNLINFSRFWPIPAVNVTDRDYFQALKGNAKPETYVSRPVPNRGNGGWVIYVARRLNDQHGKFMGLILGAVSMQYFENFFGATSSGAGSSVALLRNDGTMLARFPLTDRIGETASGLAQRALAAGGTIRDVSTLDHQRHIRSARALANYPLIIMASQTEESALGGWRQMTQLLTLMSAVCTLVVLLAAFAIARWWREQARATRSAAAASQAKSSFLAMMSHEIRTPMNAVLGLSTTLLDSRLDAEQRRVVTAIHGAGSHLLQILNDILDFSKLEFGQVSLEPVTFSPAMLVRAAVSILGPRASAKGIVIETTEDPSLPAALTGDVGRIRQVLLNLVSNAVKFTERGTVAISVRCRRQDANTATIEWSVSDSGIGIAPERIKDLFEDFTHADESIHRRFGGSGLGLAICRRLVEQLGGEIGVTSTPGVGSTFRFSVTLPVAEEETPVERGDEEVYAAFKGHIAALGRPLRVLVVDDNATNRLVAAQMLKDFDVQTSMACDGAEAVAAATSFPCDAILMDVCMPEMDGLQATRAIRGRGGPLASLPIIAFTANAFAEDIQACRDAGMDDCLIKPVRKKLLVETLLRLTASGKPGVARDVSDAEATPTTAELSTPVSGVAAAASSGQLDEGSITPPDATAVIDYDAYRTLVEEIGEAAAELFDVFVAETQVRLELLRRLADMSERNRIEREAHSLKGAAATFGLNLLAQLARELQFDAQRIDADAYGTLLDRIEAAFAAAREALARKFGEAA
jgi:signal transduction histidine kinase/DNA-binding NarL/FixJ family response regulator/HPt (histidine-containing phosphotransfer) domain-containing protein